MNYMNYMNKKKGISLIVLVVTIIIAVVLTVAVVVSLDSNIKDSKLNSFAYEILNIEDTVKSYYITYDELPSKETYSYEQLIAQRRR